ncbi:MAG: metal-dependent hydrolase with the TIM-barrel fold protein [Clostridia bacterium]|nr:metal-dependent hydrolase with the TIM-barrel fold protein [Clostridia bacterium]
MTVYKGTIISVDANNGIYGYLVEDKGRIVFVGDALPDIYANFAVTELNEGAMLPAFVDTHSHFASFAVLATTVRLNNAKSNKEILEILKKSDDNLKKGKTILAYGAHSRVEEGQLITKAELDPLFPKRIVIIITNDGHSAVLNSAALKKMPESLSTVRGYNYDTGIMKNEAFYRAADNLPKVLDKLDVLSAFQDAIDEYVSKGVGTVHAMSGSGFPRDMDVDFLTWLARGQDSGFQMRIFIQSFDTAKATKRKLPRIGGCFKTALDGSITSRDAAMLEPYEGTDNKGILYYSDEELFDNIDRANRQGLQIQMHAIGDAAFAQGTRVLKRALDAYPRDDHRHGLIHSTLNTEEGIQICKDYNIQILAQPAFLIPEVLEYMYKALGDRLYKGEQYKTFLDNGIVLSAGSDAPVTMPEPLEWIYKACNHPNEAQRVTLEQAIRMCTYNGCYATFDEKKRGSLEVGKIADMVIIDKNPYNTPINKLKDIKVVNTILSGRFYQPKKKNIIATIIKGMLKKGVC